MSSEVHGTKNEISNGLYSYGEALELNALGVHFLRMGQQGLAGGQYSYAASEFTSAGAHFSGSADKCEVAQPVIDEGMEGSNNPSSSEILAWNNGTATTQRSLQAEANSLSSEASRIAKIPPQAAAAAMMAAQMCLGRVEVAIGQGESFAAVGASMIEQAQWVEGTI